MDGETIHGTTRLTGSLRDMQSELLLDGDAVRAFPTGDGELAEVEVVVDRMSVPYLSGATIDFADTIEKQGFTIDNPNAVGTCACGESFH